MNDSLEIKFKSQKQIFKILDDEVTIDLKTVKHKIKFSISFDDMQKDFNIVNGSLDKTTNRLYISLFFNFFLALALIIVSKQEPIVNYNIVFFLLALPLIYVISSNSQRHEEKHIKSSKLFYFIYTKKNAQEVDDFIELIFKNQVQFYRRKYFILDPVLPYNLQLERYIWLYTNKYITENEYEIIKEDLDNYFNFNPTI